ncbi:MAG: hypothetical protein J6Y80_00710 [Victivallales bacterium]|nr:hypothetical protein [Victivallales bacterium]
MVHAQDTAERRRKLSWVLENSSGGRRRFRRGLDAGGGLARLCLAILAALAVLGVFYEYFG